MAVVVPPSGNLEPAGIDWILVQRGRRFLPAIAAMLFAACGDARTTSLASDSGIASVGAGTGGGGGGGGDAGIFDLGGDGQDGGGPPPAQSCKAADDVDIVPCETKTPPDEIELATQWTFQGDGANWGSTATPLVANLTDDNRDGVVDLCDVPDVVLPVFSGDAARIYVLDGATGAVHFSIDHPVASSSTPALGDIDGDGEIEIVAVEPQAIDDQFRYVAHVVAFEADGSLAWRSDQPVVTSDIDAVALADVDADGDVEILLKASMFDHTGRLLWSHTPDDGLFWDATAAADLDGDGQLEIITGAAAFRVDGSPYYPPIADQGGFWTWGFPQVGDIDGDRRPEVVFLTAGGITIIEDDGTISASGLHADDVEDRPGAILDVDGDGIPEFSAGYRTTQSLFSSSMQPLWTTKATDQSCCAGPAAFDFLGDGSPELVYAGDLGVEVIDGSGKVVATWEHGSGTGNETPAIADVDNDGSAEILFINNMGVDDAGNPLPTLVVLGDPGDRWVQARRIWNQHTYHVTNIREDGVVPQHEEPSWKKLGTFRTQAAISNGVACTPPVG